VWYLLTRACGTKAHSQPDEYSHVRYAAWGAAAPSPAAPRGAPPGAWHRSALVRLGLQGDLYRACQRHRTAACPLSAGQRQEADAKLAAAVETYRRIGAGEPWIARVTSARQTSLAVAPQPAPLPTRRAAYPDALSALQVAVLRLLAAGRSNKAISAQLVTRVVTVPHHRRTILAKTGAPHRTEATASEKRKACVAHFSLEARRVAPLGTSATESTCVA